MNAVRLVVRLALCAGITLFLAELLLRVAEAGPVRSLQYARPGAGGPGRGPFHPDQRFMDRFDPRRPYRIAVNSLGYRGEEISVEKPPGTVRIVALGGANTFGRHVEGDDAWPARVGAMLRDRWEDRFVESINAGAPGLSLQDQIDHLEAGGLALDPDVIVAAWDAGPEGFGASSRTRGPAGQAEEPSPLYPLSARLRQTALFNTAGMVAGAARRALDSAARAGPVSPACGRPLTPAGEEALAGDAAQIRRLRRLAGHRGLPMVLMLIPCREQSALGALPAAQDRLGAAARSEGVTVVDLLPAFRLRDPRGRKFFHAPGHASLTSRGHLCAADELGKALAGILAADAPAEGATAPGGWPAQRDAAR
ncbi:MAG TPA: hypothetical protein VJV23_12700 [Candidatus Polarisedimenticolia bacterium]|nr:hypothetical protein [Candidatus Polarisedimenticolia bacterium]